MVLTCTSQHRDTVALISRKKKVAHVTSELAAKASSVGAGSAALGTWRFDFGKHSGTLVSEVYQNHPDYILFLMEKGVHLKANRGELLTALEACGAVRSSATARPPPLVGAGSAGGKRAAKDPDWSPTATQGPPKKKAKAVRKGDKIFIKWEGAAEDGGGTFECMVKGTATKGFTVVSVDGRFEDEADFDQIEDEWWYSKRDIDIDAAANKVQADAFAAAAAASSQVHAGAGAGVADEATPDPVGAHLALAGVSGGAVLTAVQAIYDRYTAMKVMDLQTLLKINGQRSTGDKGNNKASLIKRCVDREMFGALPECDSTCGGEAFNTVEYADAFKFSLESASNWRHNGTVGKVSCQGFFSPPTYEGGPRNYIGCSKFELSVQRLPWVAEIPQAPKTGAGAVKVRPTAAL